MKIAVLGFGPQSNAFSQIKSPVSQAKGLRWSICPDTIYFAESKRHNLNEAIKNLGKEEAKRVGYVNMRSGKSRANADIAPRICEWAKRTGFDAVIWNDVPTKRNDVYDSSLSADFSLRDEMMPTSVPKEEWFHPRYGRWGPKTITFPAAEVPQGVDSLQWKRDRVVEAAKHFTGLVYKRDDGQRGHFPQRGCGLDCSNFASWIYNYALGIKFTSDVDELYSLAQVGRKLANDEPLQKGDLLFYDTTPKHVVIYVDEQHVIDSTSCRPEGVQIRDLYLSRNHWYRPTADNPLFLGAQRPIDA